MSYTPTVWQDGITRLNPTNMNNIEQGIEQNSLDIENIQAQTTANTTQIEQLQVGDSNAMIGVYTVNATGTDTYVATYSGLVYFTDMHIDMFVSNINTGASTLNINSLGAISIKIRQDDGTLRDVLSGEINGFISLTYDGTYFVANDNSYYKVSRSGDTMTGDLIAPNIIVGRPLVSDAVMSYYLDFTSGNDLNDGLTALTAFKTWSKLQSKIPYKLYHSFSGIIIGSYPTLISVEPVEGMTNASRFQIRGSTTTPSDTVLNGIEFIGHKCSVDYTTANATLRYIQSTGEITVRDSQGIILSELEPRNSGGVGVRFRASRGYVQSSTFGTGVVQDAISCDNSNVFSSNNSGSATRYGLVANTASKIGKLGTQPTGGTANENTSGGGTIS